MLKHNSQMYHLIDAIICHTKSVTPTFSELVGLSVHPPVCAWVKELFVEDLDLLGSASTFCSRCRDILH